MGWLVCAVYALAFVLLVVTGNLWCLALSAFALFAVLVSATFAVAREQAGHDTADDGAEDFGGSFRGHGASDE